MAGTTWTKFFWSDWAADPSLKLCSLAAQGLWMRMLCIAAEAEPVGYVVVGGRGLTSSDLARMCGCSKDEAETLLEELENNGVFSRDSRGKIYSRRMVRDAKSSKINKENGKKGGNPTLRNLRVISGGVNRDDNQGVKRGDNQGDKPGVNGWDNTHLKPHKPEAISHKPENNNLASQPNGKAAVFDRVEAALRRLEGLSEHPVAADPVLAPIIKLVEKGLDLDTQIIPSIKRQLATAKRPVSRWGYFAAGIEDDAAEKPAGGFHGSAATTTPVDWAKRIGLARMTRQWPNQWGPWPHTPGCPVPPELLKPDDGEGWTAWEDTA